MKSDLRLRFKNEEEANKFWEFSLDMRIMAKLLEFMIMEKQPRNVKNPQLNNHIRRIKESAEFIQKDAGYALITNKLDYANDHAYAMYRIFNVIRLCEKDDLEDMATQLEKQSQEALEIVEKEQAEHFNQQYKELQET